MSLQSYLPQDRQRALLLNQALPDRLIGSVLFADISGFTALTETLRDQLGNRQGAEELTSRLKVVYNLLINELEQQGGSVIGFAGDSMLCWFDAGEESDATCRQTASRAIVAALSMQNAIRQCSDMALKIAVASGSARRMLVGDPGIQILDVLGGNTVTRTALAEQLANQGEVLVDEVTLQLLEDHISVSEWRTDPQESICFAVVCGFTGHTTWNTFEASGVLDSRMLKPWIHPVVFQHETVDQARFLTEFRPCAALFIRFSGIDYELQDSAGQLNALVQTIQNIATRYEGILMDLTIGDKGSFAYVNFGAISMHENNARRAVKTALEVQAATSLLLQMGISQGVMRVGANGGDSRKTFAAMGDDVNLAARLMSAAKPQEILMSRHVQRALGDAFRYEQRQALFVKGKAEPVPVVAVIGTSLKRAVRLQEPEYELPMVGRHAELALIEDRLTQASEGSEQIIGIVADAGMGKSRLVAEVIRISRDKGFIGLGGACQSDGQQTPYLVWKAVWQAFFELNPQQSGQEQLNWLEVITQRYAPQRLEAIPLLNTLLDTSVEDNEFTQKLEPKNRQSVLHALLEDCLKAKASEQPVLIVIEDLHWIDPLSFELLQQLLHSLSRLPVCFVLAYRPLQSERLQTSGIEELQQFTGFELEELTVDESAELLRMKLAQLYPGYTHSVPEVMVNSLISRAQGNPFYLEELINYLHDRELNLSELMQLELPDSLHALILSRIDQLSSREKNTLRVASIIGRLFHASWLFGYYPELGTTTEIKTSLDALETLEITPQDASVTELAYLYEESLSLRRELGDKWGITSSLINLGIVKMVQQDFDTAQALFAESLQLRKEMGDKWGISFSTGSIGILALIRGDTGIARIKLEEALEQGIQLDSKELEATFQLALGMVDLAEDKPAAGARIQKGLKLCRQVGEQLQQTSALIVMAGWKERQGELAEAVQLLATVDATLIALNTVIEPQMIYFHRSLLEKLHRQLNADVFEALWKEGSQSSFEKVVERMLRDTTESLPVNEA